MTTTRYTTNGNVITVEAGWVSSASEREALAAPHPLRDRELARLAALSAAQAAAKGSRYEATKTLDVAAIAKLVRADLRALGSVAKFRVTTKRYSMGQSITIEIAGYNRHASDDVRAAQEAAKLPCPWMTREAVALADRCEAILDAYNYNRSDSMTDYSDVKFHGHVNWA